MKKINGQNWTAFLLQRFHGFWSKKWSEPGNNSSEVASMGREACPHYEMLRQIYENPTI
jgi:hypothetical protein